MVIIFSIYFNLNAAHTHSQYATLHQQQLNKKAQNSKQDAYEHTEMLSFSTLSIPMWPSNCMYGFKRKQNKTHHPPQNTTELFISI